MWPWEKRQWVLLPSPYQTSRTGGTARPATTLPPQLQSPFQHTACSQGWGLHPQVHWTREHASAASCHHLWTGLPQTRQAFRISLDPWSPRVGSRPSILPFSPRKLSHGFQPLYPSLPCHIVTVKAVQSWGTHTQQTSSAASVPSQPLWPLPHWISRPIVSPVLTVYGGWIHLENQLYLIIKVSQLQWNKYYGNSSLYLC